MTEPLLCVAAGWAKTHDQIVEAAGWHGVTHVVCGSYTAREGCGNGGRTLYHANDGTTFNSKGLPNPGLDRAVSEVKRACQTLGAGRVELVLSVAPETIDEVPSMSVSALRVSSTIEINLSCPNRAGAIMGLDPGLVEWVAHCARRACATSTCAVWYKLPPTTDGALRRRLYDSIRCAHASSNPRVRASVVACNTLGVETPLLENGTRVVDPPRCGVGGTGVRELALSNAAHYCSMRGGGDPRVIGCGGVDTLETVRRYHAVGCSGVQVGSAVHAELGGVFLRLRDGAPNAWLHESYPVVDTPLKASRRTVDGRRVSITRRLSTLRNGTFSRTLKGTVWNGPGSCTLMGCDGWDESTGRARSGNPNDDLEMSP